MFKRSQSRPRARLSRSSSSSPRKNQWRGHIFVFIGALLLLVSVAFLQAKLGSFRAARRDHTEDVNLGRRSASGLLSDGRHERAGTGVQSQKTLQNGSEKREEMEVERLDLDEDSLISSVKEVESFQSKASKQLDGKKIGNGSVTLQEEDYSHDEDEEEKLEDMDTDMDLETEEMEDLENLRGAAADGLDDMDEDEDDEREEAGEHLEEVEELEDRASGRKVGKSSEGYEEEAHRGMQDSRELSAGDIDNVDTLKTSGGARNSSGAIHESGKEIDKQFDAGVLKERDIIKRIQGAPNTTKSLERSGGIKTIPRWDPKEHLATGSRAARDSARNMQRSIAQGYNNKNASEGKVSIIWDHLLGVARKAGRSQKALNPLIFRKVGLGVEGSGLGSLLDQVEERRGGSGNGSSSALGNDGKQVFSSDDEPLDEGIRERLEEVTAIEDALLLKTDKSSVRNGFLPSWIDNSAKKSSKGDSFRKERASKAPFDPLNPVNNPLLQDPDTFGPTGLTRSDKAILKALRKASIEDTISIEEKSSKADSGANAKKEDTLKSDSDEAGAGELVSRANIASSQAMGGQQKGELAARDDIDKLPRRFGLGRGRKLKEGSSHQTLLQETDEEELAVSTMSNQEVLSLKKDELIVHRVVSKVEELALAGPNLSNEEAFMGRYKKVIEDESEPSMTQTLGKSAEKGKSEMLKIMESSGNSSEEDVQNLSQHTTSESLRATEVIKEGRVDESLRDVRGSAEAGSRKQGRSNKMPRSPSDSRRWGYFPGIDPLLSFSEFMEQFLQHSKCSLRVFMAWTTPPWTYTLRYQRGLESLFHFHSEACVVVFSESIELDFFRSFVLDGYKIAVVMPNLEELLEETPADVFASIWLSWRKIDLYHIHYTELLRLAALYKYGGLYLDTDVVLLKPLDSLHNTVGAERVENYKQKINGAIMAFDRFSPFLMECLAEFTATYDDLLLEWNGAGLLTRVADRKAGEGGETWKQITGELNIELPPAFFPLSSTNITRLLEQYHFRFHQTWVSLVSQLSKDGIYKEDEANRRLFDLGRFEIEAKRQLGTNSSNILKAGFVLRLTSGSVFLLNLQLPGAGDSV